MYHLNMIYFTISLWDRTTDRPPILATARLASPFASSRQCSLQFPGAIDFLSLLLAISRLARLFCHISLQLAWWPFCYWLCLSLISETTKLQFFFLGSKISSKFKYLQKWLGFRHTKQKYIKINMCIKVEKILNITYKTS
jgi:hypothetical protein